MARILIVDDERHIREWLAVELSGLYPEVITTASCHTLMKKIETLQPDLLILDIKLGDCDGLEMLQKIRGWYVDLPIILFSAYDSYKYDIRSIAADYYVVKSFDLTELKEKIGRALEAGVPCLGKAAG